MRKWLLITAFVALAVLLVLGVGGYVLYRASQQVPEFYREALQAAPKAREEASDEMVQHCLDSTWIRRAGQPLDIAQAVGFLASEHAGWITGEMLNVDGGFGVHDGEDFEHTARMVVGDAAMDDAKGKS